MSGGRAKGQVAVRGWMLSVVAQGVNAALARLHIHPDELEPKVDLSEFDNDPRKSIVQIFEKYTTKSMVFVGYDDSESISPPIFYSQRLGMGESRRLLKDIANKNPDTAYKGITEELHKTVANLNEQFKILHQGSLPP